MLAISKHACLCLFILTCTLPALGQRSRQPREVVEAYRVCERFQRILGEDLDFNRAFEATFSRNPARRRAIAIAEGEFDADNLTGVDEATLIDAFKSRMQIVYLMLPLASPDSNEEEALFFPPPIKAIFTRKAPDAPAEFPSFAAQLKRDAVDLRAHLNKLAAADPRVAERVRQFKADLSKESTLPTSIVRPLTSYSRSHVLGPKEKYYQIGDYAVIREGTQMRIIGIRFFSRLF